MIFDGTFLSWVFLYLDMHNFFFLHCGLHLFKVLDNKWYSSQYVCIMWKETIKGMNGPRKTNVLFSSMVFLCNFFWVKRIFWYLFWSFDLIDCITSLLDYTNPMLLSHLYFYKYVLNDILFIFQNKGKQSKHSKCTYLSNNLNKIKQKLK